MANEHEMMLSLTNHWENPNQNYSEILPQPIRLAVTKKQKTSVRQDVEKNGIFMQHWWKCKMIKPSMENSIMFLKLKTELSYNTTILLLGIYIQNS